MVNMPDSKVLDRILDDLEDEQFWVKEVEFPELRLAAGYDESEGNIIVQEPAANRWADLRAINYVTAALWDPKTAFDLLRDEAPNNGEDIIDSMNAMINAPAPQVKTDEFLVCRTRGFIRQVSEIAAELANDRREDNYTYRVFRVMCESEPDLNVGVNPLGETKEFYGRRGPVKIVLPEPEDESEIEHKSASDAGW